jgi:hypothetical protein
VISNVVSGGESNDFDAGCASGRVFHGHSVVVLNERSNAVGINEETRLVSAQRRSWDTSASLSRGAVSGRQSDIGISGVASQCEPVRGCWPGRWTRREARLQHSGAAGARARRQSRHREVPGATRLGRAHGQMPPRALESLHEEMSRREVPVTTLGSSLAQSGARVVGADDAEGYACSLSTCARLPRAHRLHRGHPEDDDARADCPPSKSHQEVGWPSRNYLEEGRWNVDATTRATQKCFSRSRPPTAIVCASDEMALIACRTARADTFCRATSRSPASAIWRGQPVRPRAYTRLRSV